jgi:hypothetical protein
MVGGKCLLFDLLGVNGDTSEVDPDPMVLPLPQTSTDGSNQSGSHNLLSALPGGGRGEALVSNPGPSLLCLTGVDMFEELAAITDLGAS